MLQITPEFISQYQKLKFNLHFKQIRNLKFQTLDLKSLSSRIKINEQSINHIKELTKVHSTFLPVQFGLAVAGMLAGNRPSPKVG